METEINFNDLKVNGIQVCYFFVCQRKLWLYSKRITMENKSDKVLLGKILHEDSYKDSQKDVLIDNLINIDIVDNHNIREVKSSDKMAEADKMQLLYYLYYLKTLGINRKGIINYPKQRKRDFIELTPELESEVVKTLIGIKKIMALKKPPPVIKEPYCKKCAYYELCYV